MASVEAFRGIINERLSAAADEIFTLFRSVVLEYEEELERQRRLVELASKPEDTNETEILQQNVCVEAVGIDPQLMKEESFSLDQHPPEPQPVKDEQRELCISLEEEQVHLKQEANAFMLTPAVEGSDQGEELVETRQDHSEREQEDSGPITEPEPAEPAPRKVNRQSKNKRKSVGSNTKRHFDARKKSIKCDPRSKYLAYTSKLQRSLRQHEGKKLHPCEICGKGFAYKSVRDKHVRIHKAEKSDLSQRVCSLRLELKSQTTTDKNEKPVEICGKQLGCARILKVYLKRHSVDRRFLCKTCGKRFAKSSVLKNHITIHTGEKPYTCDTCGKKFSLSSGLKSHMRVHSGEKPFLCNTCGRRFAYTSGLQHHMKIHTGERPYSCETCGKKFTGLSSLRCHERIHTGEKPHSCGTCGRKFSRSQLLKAHMRVHTGEKPFLCKTCGKKFAYKSGLNNHTKHHTGERRYSCDTCGKHFGRSSVLKSHMKVHTGEKPFSCQECRKCFTTKSHMMRHMSIHTGERPHACQMCKKTFRNPDDLKGHVRRMHKKEKP